MRVITIKEAASAIYFYSPGYLRLLCRQGKIKEARKVGGEWRIVYEEEIGLSICGTCYCMTKTIDSKCGKCGSGKIG